MRHAQIIQFERADILFLEKMKKLDELLFTFETTFV